MAEPLRPRQRDTQVSRMETGRVLIEFRTPLSDVSEVEVDAEDAGKDEENKQGGRNQTERNGDDERNQNLRLRTGFGNDWHQANESRER